MLHRVPDVKLCADLQSGIMRKIVGTRALAYARSHGAESTVCAVVFSNLRKDKIDASNRLNGRYTLVSR
eukprot:3007286-Pleurochrysis_carterae.AAC.1